MPKYRVRSGEIKLLLGTDAASEGLNLQRLGTLIKIDLPWNRTRLEQLEGRIQRNGQARNQIWIANLRYRDSVEDKVHRVLAERLQAIHELFGQIPDTWKTFGRRWPSTTKAKSLNCSIRLLLLPTPSIGSTARLKMQPGKPACRF
jgi:superfamily II DNA or RNA helicase